MYSDTSSILDADTSSILDAYTPSMLHSYTPSMLHSYTPSILHCYASTPSYSSISVLVLLYIRLDTATTCAPAGLSYETHKRQLTKKKNYRDYAKFHSVASFFFWCSTGLSPQDAQVTADEAIEIETTLAKFHMEAFSAVLNLLALLVQKYKY